MKKLIYILAVGSILIASCDKKLDVNPEQDLPTDLAFANKENSFASLMGVYSKSQLYDVFGSLPQIIGDYQADNVNFAGSFPTLQDIDTYGVKSDNSNVLGIWREHFRSEERMVGKECVRTCNSWWS